MPTTSYEQCKRFTQLTFDVIEFLKKLARMMQIGATWVNIGAGHGTSALAVSEARPDINIITIDIREDHPTGSLKGERDLFHDWVELGAFRQPEQILSDSAQAGKKWDRGLVDCVFIDADHTEKGCRGDWDAWKKHIRPQGLVIFHDYASVWGPGVAAVVHDVIKLWQFIGIADTTIAFQRPLG